MSQIVSCTQWVGKEDLVTCNDLLERIKNDIRNCEAHVTGRLRLFDAIQVNAHEVPLHALFSATWRRYQYILPLQFTTNIRMIINKTELEEHLSSENGKSMDRIYYLDVEYLNIVLGR